VKYCDLLDWIRAKWLGIDKKIVPVSEKRRRNPWGFRQQGWSTPTETGINDGERRLFDISSALTSGVWDWMADIVTVIDIASPCWRLKSSEDRRLRSCERSATCWDGASISRRLRLHVVVLRLFYICWFMQVFVHSF